MKKQYGFILILLLVFAVVQSGVADSHAPDMSAYEELNGQVVASIDKGLEWLKGQQGEDGLFANHPGITALVLTAFLRHPENKYPEAEHPFIQKGPSGAGSTCSNQTVLFIMLRCNLHYRITIPLSR